MRNLRELLAAFFLGGLSTLIILGAISISFSEAMLLPLPTETAMPDATINLPETGIVPQTQTSLPVIIITGTPQSATETPLPTIFSFPKFPTATPTQCLPPATWVTYIVQAGDNLYRISLAYRVSVSALQTANCMGNSQFIYTGQALFVPNVPTRTPTITVSPTPTITPSATSTSTSTATATSTASKTPTATATFSPTITLTPTATSITP